MSREQSRERKIISCVADAKVVRCAGVTGAEMGIQVDPGVESLGSNISKAESSKYIFE